MVSEHLTSWLGYPVHPLGFEELEEKIPDLSHTVCRLHLGWDAKDTFGELFSQFLNVPGVERTPALIIGAFSGDDPSMDTRELVELLVNAHARLPALRGIFLGDIIGEENEISWINQSDVSPLFAAYPKLEHFTVRGGTGLVLGKLSHANLKSLVIQTGGLPRAVLADLARSNLPALEHLELWLGTDNYGWDGTVADVQPLLDPRRFPKLRTLGLKNSEIQDDIVTHVSASPLVAQLEVLDFSMGTLTDAGAEALLRHPELKRLKKIDLQYNYLTPEMAKRVSAAFPQADVSDPQQADEDDGEVYRNVAVSE